MDVLVINLLLAMFDVDEEKDHSNDETNRANDNVGDPKERVLATEHRRLREDDALGPRELFNFVT